ncbi:MAG TPA: hypothetical protein VGZ22_25805 [Isosphaeraceae bacterium]|nr:hypothetical protein [Isosphaeraceae bacterium]
MPDEPLQATAGVATRRWYQFRLPALFGLVLVCALASAAGVRWWKTQAPWEPVGGMIGWTESAVTAQLGPPSEVVEADAPDENGHYLRSSPPGPYRTLMFRTSHGVFVVWFHKQSGRYVSFRSRFQNTYY